MLPILLAILTLAVLYWFPLRRWFGRWGTTRDELTRTMTGDTVIVNPTHSATHAVTVNAPPNDIWPWLGRWAISAADCTAMTGLIGSLAS